MGDTFYDIGSFNPCRSVGYLMRRATKLMLGQAEAQFVDRELSFSQWVALTAVGNELADNCAKLARYLDHNSGATTRLVDQLEDRGLLARVRQTGDRRVVNLALTDEGRRMLASQNPRMVEMWNELLVGFGRDEIETFLGLLGRLTRALETREATLAAQS